MATPIYKLCCLISCIFCFSWRLRHGHIILCCRPLWSFMDIHIVSGAKMAFWRDHPLLSTKVGFIIRPEYINAHVNHSIRYIIGIIGQFALCHILLTIEMGRYGPAIQKGYVNYDTLRSKRIQNTMTWSSSFCKSFGRLNSTMYYSYQSCLKRFLVKLHRPRETLLWTWFFHTTYAYTYGRT